MRKKDDGVRGKFAICLSLREDEDGGVEITMDDVELDDPNPRSRQWRHDVFITFGHATEEEIKGHISPKRYEDFGRFVLGALVVKARHNLRHDDE